MRHLRAAVVEKSRQPSDLVHVFSGGGRDRMNLQARVFALQLDQGVVSLQRSLKRSGRDPKPIVEFRHAVEREFDRKEPQARLTKRFAKLRDGLFSIPAVARNVDLFDPVLVDELSADRAEFLAQKWLAAREVEIF